MTIKTDVDLDAAFGGREIRKTQEGVTVPERIRTDAPRPALRPGGDWATRAAAVDQAVREAQDAEKARNEWAQRQTVTHKPGMKLSFNRSGS